jgi:acetylornithine deacetylase
MTDAVHAAVHAEIDRRQDEIVTFLSDLVRFPSVNRPPRGDELACQQFIEGYYHTMALAVDVFQPDEIPNIEASPGWWPGSDFTDRPNVIGTRRGTGDGRSLLMLAHVDVVPEGPHELWRHGPFNPVVEDGALIGRGSADDKSGIAAQTMALQCLEAAGFRPRGDVIIASVVDEESAGANGTLAALLRPHLAEGCVYTDGMQNEIHVAQLGGVNFDIEIQLHPKFAGTTIDHAMEILPAFYQELKQYTNERREKIDADPLYAGGRWPDYAVRMIAFQAGSFDGGNAGGGRIRGSAYILPSESTPEIQRDIQNRIARVAERFGERVLPPRITTFGRIMPPSAVDQSDPFVGVVAASYERATGLPAQRTGMPMSDLFQFLLHSPRPMPTVAMGCATWGGPGGVHEPNEAVLIDEHLIPFTKTLASLIIDWCGVDPA